MPGAFLPAVRRPLLLTAFTLAAVPAFAAGQLVDAMVVPGVLPAEAAAATYQASSYAAAVPQPAPYAASSYAVAAAPPSAPYPGTQPRSNLGGGFIEMLVSGGGPAAMPPAVLYNQPQAAAPAPRSSYYASYAPEPQQPAYETRRTVDPAFLRAEVADPTGEAPGTIVVDTPSKYLYHVQGNGRAVRYGIGVGRPGFTWSGVKSVTRKAEWPDWTPPPEMIRRRPDLPRHMVGGPENPLGARAMYLGSSLYRIHGTNEPYTIGQNVSSGCIRMMNEDVTDLYGRVQVGTRVVVR